MKELPLTQGYVALVDDQDFPLLSGVKWRVFKKGRGIYAGRDIRKDGRKTTLYLHQAIISTLFQVDHRDGNGLNNQRENLRPATNQQNHWGFQTKKKEASSRFRGVTWDAQTQKWRAKITVDGTSISIGRFSEEEDAARAYDTAARKHFTDFAAPNFSL